MIYIKIIDNLKKQGIRITSLGTVIALLSTGASATLAISKNSNDNIIKNVKEIDSIDDSNYNLDEKATYKTTISVSKKVSLKDDVINIGDYNGNSIVDALNQAGYDSSFASRKELAKKYKIKNYEGTAKQNIKLLNILKKEVKKLTKQKLKVVNLGYDKLSKHNHRYKLSNIEYKDNGDDTHTIIKEYECIDSDCKETKQKITIADHKFSNYQALDEEKEIGTCICGAENKRDHTYGDWIVSIDGKTESSTCETCGYVKTKEKVQNTIPTYPSAPTTPTIPTDPTYNYVKKEETITPNNDGTHKITTIYECVENGDIKVETVDVACISDGNISYEQSDSDNMHYEVSNCSVCNEPIKIEKTCLPVDEVKCIKINDTIYEYQECELCHDECNMVEHTEHQYSEWEYRDQTTHVRYCICVEERQIENHDIHLENNESGMEKVCDICNGREPVPEHEHAKKYDTFWDLMLSGTISTYPYGTPVRIKNPNPSKDDYCLRVEYQCPFCGVPYSIYYDHEFKTKDGITYTCDNLCSVSYQDTSIISLVDMIDKIEEEKELDENTLGIKRLVKRK